MMVSSIIERCLENMTHNTTSEECKGQDFVPHLIFTSWVVCLRCDFRCRKN